MAEPVPSHRPGGRGLRARLSYGVAWNTLGTASTQGSAFFVSLTIANLLGKEPFGQFSIVLATVLTLSSIAQVATGVTATRYIAQYRSSDPLRAGRVLGLCSIASWCTGSIVTVLLLVLAPWLATNVLNEPGLTLCLRIGAFAVLFSAVNGFQMGALAGLESYRALGRASVLQGVLHFGFCGLGTWLGGIPGAVSGLTASLLCRWAIFGRVLHLEASAAGIHSIRTDLHRERRILWRFALPAAACGLTFLPALWIGQALLARQAGGFAELSLYAAANNLRVLVLFAPLIINTVGMSVLSNHVGSGDPRRYRKVYWAVLAATAATASAGAAVIAFLGPWLLSWFGSGFEDGHSVLTILLASTIAEALAIAAYQAMQSHERMWLSLFAVNLPRDALMVFLAWVLTPVWGAKGLAIAYALAWTLAIIVIAVIVWRLGLNPGASTMARPSPPRRNRIEPAD